METIEHDGDTWRVLARGVTREDGKTFCHLASTTRSQQQRNGARPVQVNDWVDLEEARRVAAVTAYYSDKSRPGQPPKPPGAGPPPRDGPPAGGGLV